jgi:hypothetical protein
MQPGSPDKTCLGHVVLCGDGVERNITARCHSLHSVVQHIQISDPLAPFAAIQMLSAQIGQEECVTQPLCAAHVSPLNRHPPGRRCTHTTRTLDKTPRPLGPHTISRANYDYVLLDVQSQWAMCQRLHFIYGALICRRPRMMVLVSRLAMYHDQPDLAS